MCALTHHAHQPLSTSFFFNDTATTEIYTLSLHDALPIYRRHVLADTEVRTLDDGGRVETRCLGLDHAGDFEDADLVDFGDRKSTRLNSSHGYISYAVFCLKKKKEADGADAQRAVPELRSS